MSDECELTAVSVPLFPRSAFTFCFCNKTSIHGTVEDYVCAVCAGSSCLLLVSFSGGGELSCDLCPAV